MNINFECNDTIAHIRNDKVSYVLEVIDNKYIVNRYYGKSIRKFSNSNEYLYFKRGFVTNHDSEISHLSFDDFPFEYPTRGCGDFRIPALSVTTIEGIEHIELSFKEWKIIKDKPQLNGLPSTYSNDDSITLEIVLEDSIAGIRVKMFYTIFDKVGIIARHQVIQNTGDSLLTLNNAMSCSLDLPSRDLEFLSLYGTHIHEGNINRFKLLQGIQRIESNRGISSAQHQPFYALVTPLTNESQGECYAFHLVYSGNFSGLVEKDQFGCIRAQLGINPDTFKWNLNPGEEFTTPEVILNYSSNGLKEMTHNFHYLYLNNLISRKFDANNRPILLNSWEAMYYDVSMDKIKNQVEIARELGIELYVLDDGWFRKGNSSLTGIGDWKCNLNKLPQGIDGVSKLVHDAGMKFGLWFEPEMLSPNSDLFKSKPEWALQVPGYQIVIGRGSYVLDLTNYDVQCYIISVFDRYLSNGLIDYIKWDMNRPLSNVNSLFLESHQKGEVWHRYILGLYKILETVTKKYPHVLIEGCSSGGGRFDPGMLYYTPQIWTSDNTDAYDRTKIQSGYSLLYPLISLGAHVSEVPNHQTGRVISLDTRYQVARFGNLGYELDVMKCNTDELTEIKEQIAKVKRYRSIFYNGKFYRHDVESTNYTMWSVVSSDQEEVFITIIQKMHNPEETHNQFKLIGLKANYEYTNLKSMKSYGGDELMEVGITIPLKLKDFYATEFHFKVLKVEGED